MRLMFFVGFVISSVFAIDPSCVVHQKSQRMSANFDFQQKTSWNLTSYHRAKRQRYNSVNIQLIGYSDNKYGHYVSFSENNQTNYYVNDTLVSTVYSGVFCVSPSYQPKELMRTWVKSYHGKTPFEVNTSYVGSVTLKCGGVYCSEYNVLDNTYVECQGNVSFPSNIGIKVNLTFKPQKMEYSYSSDCSFEYTSMNGTHSCEQHSISKNSYTTRYLNTTLDAIAYNMKPTKVRTILHLRHLKQASGYLDNSTQHYSVCQEKCMVLPVDDSL